MLYRGEINFTDIGNWVKSESPESIELLSYDYEYYRAMLPDDVKIASPLRFRGLIITEYDGRDPA